MAERSSEEAAGMKWVGQKATSASWVPEYGEGQPVANISGEGSSGASKIPLEKRKLVWLTEKYPEMKEHIEATMYKPTDGSVPTFRSLEIDESHLQEKLAVRSQLEDSWLRSFIKKNPIIPLGCAATVGALIYGLRAMVTGDMVKSNMAMRARIGAQGFTILALIAGTIALKWQEDQLETPKNIIPVDIHHQQIRAEHTD